MKKIILYLFLFLFPLITFAEKLPSHYLILGTEHSKYKFYKIKDIFICKSGYIYILEAGNGQIIKLSSTGKLIKIIGRIGQKDGELFEPQSFCFINNEIWIADSGNGRISVFKNEKFNRSISISYISSPSQLVRFESGCFVSSDNLRGKNSKNMQIIDRNGKPLHYLDIALEIDKEVDTFWNFITLKQYSKNKCLVGFKFHNTIKIINQNGCIETDKNMDEFYPKFEGENEGKKVPFGFSAIDFSEGPNETIFVVTCDFDKKNCNKIIQFDASLTKIIKEFSNLPYRIAKLYYNPENKILVIITAVDEILFYKI